jgi:hypothetical protein
MGPRRSVGAGMGKCCFVCVGVGPGSYHENLGAVTGKNIAPSGDVAQGVEDKTVGVCLHHARGAVSKLLSGPYSPWSDSGSSYAAYS